MFGPNLLCILAIVFLSATVTKATLNKAGIVINNTSNIEIKVIELNIICFLSKLYLYNIYYIILYK